MNANLILDLPLVPYKLDALVAALDACVGRFLPLGRHRFNGSDLRPHGRVVFHGNVVLAVMLLQVVPFRVHVQVAHVALVFRLSPDMLRLSFMGE